MENEASNAPMMLDGCILRLFRCTVPRFAATAFYARLSCGNAVQRGTHELNVTNRHYASNISFLLRVPPEKMVCFDLETTGLSSRQDEILQVAMVSGLGEVLLDQLIKPARHVSWQTAQRITGITPAMVANSPSIRQMAGRIQEILDCSGLVVGYNLPFDARFLEAAGIRMPNCLYFDVMRAFAPIAGKRNSTGNYRWMPLAECARHYGVSYSAHDALEDACATLACFHAMLRDEQVL